MEVTKGFGSDNHSGVHPKILQSLAEINEGHHPSYGTDSLTAQCNQLFKKHFGENIESFFVFNGTAANVLALAPFVRSYHSVFCAESSHLYQDECGAPEKHLGCKLIPLPSPEGKITPQDIRDHMIRPGDQHFSQPKMISITQPTEVGTLYSLEELKELRQVADEFDLFFHMDGARFVVAAESMGLTFSELTTNIGIDSLSFGGTKNGLLFGEAVILFKRHSNIDYKDFKFLRKQFLQLPSKQRFIAQQFITLLKDDFYRQIISHEIEMAKCLKQGIMEIPQVELWQKVQSNVVFVKIPKPWTQPLKKKHFFYVWDEKLWVMRWMCSFDTTKQDVDSFVQAMKELSSKNL